MKPFKKLMLGLLVVTCIHSTTAFAENTGSDIADSGDVTNDASQTQPSTMHKVVNLVVDELRTTWQSKDVEWYIPINTWHNRSSYTHEQIAKYNERPWGIGMGKYRYDADGDWHGLYTMAFLDSQSKWEPVIGYGFQKVWEPKQALKFGLGYTVGLTFRDDMHYVPIPLLLPLMSIKYQSVALQSTYIPGGKGNGNVLFTWIRWELP